MVLSFHGPDQTCQYQMQETLELELVIVAIISKWRGLLLVSPYKIIDNKVYIV